MLARLVRASSVGLFALVGAAGAARAEAPARTDLVTRRVWVAPERDLAPDALAASLISNILYVNRCVGNCTVTPGVNDARENTSSIIDETVTLSEFALGDEVYDEVIECLRDVYAPYDVVIVTEDPGASTLHHEAIMAGTAQQLGLNPNIGGLAPASCGPLNNVISFSFGNMSGMDAETLCWTVAQESAHAFGLPNHVYDCLDPMTYLPGPCGRKYFRNRGIRCGDFEPMDCECGVNEQNSHLALLDTFGPGATPPPPEVEVLYPDPDAVVEDNFSIFFTAIDPRLVDHIDVFINGTRYQSMPGHNYQNRDDEYNLEAPDLPDGYIDVEVRAYNDINVEAGSAATTVLKGEPCTSADQCFDFMACQDGRCSYPPAAGGLGDECPYEQFCVGLSCVEADGERRCSRGCDPSVTRSCPIGFECLEAGFCWPAADEGGCCAVAGGQGRDEGFPLVALSLFAGAVLLLRRGRRARRATIQVSGPWRTSPRPGRCGRTSRRC